MNPVRNKSPRRNEISNGVKLIVGLGNPGLIYANSRHNIGFLVIKALSRICRVFLKRDKFAYCLSARARIGDHETILATPLTYMNLSGVAVAALIKKYKVKADGLLVVCDDLDLEFSRLRVRPDGSSGGHRGMQSIIDSLETRSFARLRIGIGRPGGNKEARDYVLSNFSAREKPKIKETIGRATDCCQFWVDSGTAKSMEIFNRRGE